MAIQDKFRTFVGKQVFSETILALNNVLNRSNYRSPINTCTPISELPSNISTMRSINFPFNDK